jgi:hypothetical protein
MDIERKDNTRGLAGTALGLGAGALGVQLLNGGLNGLLGGWGNGCGNGYGWNGYNGGMPIVVSEGDHCVNRYEAGQSARIAELETQKSLLESSIYVDGKLNDFRNYVDNRFATVEHELCDQRVFNSTAINNISCISGQVAQLMGLTKLVVPNTSVCSGGGNVTITPAAAPTTTTGG